LHKVPPFSTADADVLLRIMRKPKPPAALADPEGLARNRLRRLRSLALVRPAPYRAVTLTTAQWLALVRAGAEFGDDDDPQFSFRTQEEAPLGSRSPAGT
jgi:hypothetical protein